MSSVWGSDMTEKLSKVPLNRTNNNNEGVLMTLTFVLANVELLFSEFPVLPNVAQFTSVIAQIAHLST